MASYDSTITSYDGLRWYTTGWRSFCSHPIKQGWESLTHSRPNIYLDSKKRKPITQSACSNTNHQFHLTVVNNIAHFSHGKRDNFFDRYRDIYAAIRAKPPRNHSRRPLTLPTCSPEYEPLRRGDRRKSWRARVRASESERYHCACEKKRTRGPFSSLSPLFSLWFQLARDLANVLVTREVASVSIDLHLVQRAELLRGSSVRPSVRSSCSRATWQIAVPGSSSHCFLFFFCPRLRTDVTRSILVGTGACEPE